MASHHTSPGACCGCTARAPAPAPVDGRFSLVDHFGQPVTERSWGGRHLLVFFGFTHCAVVCPRELAKISAVLVQLGEGARRIQPLYITVDPERDTAVRLRSYLDASAPAFIGLTGSPAAIEDVKRRFRVFARKQEDAQAPGGYVVPHTAFAYLLGPDGAYVAHFSDALSAPELAERLSQQLG